MIATETLLRFAYLANAVILTPVLASLFFGDHGTTLAVFGNVVPESKGLRLLVASLWTAILVCSAVGWFEPRLMVGILVLQIVYKALWLAIYVAPLVVAGKTSEVPWGVALTFVPIVLLWPYVVFRALSHG